MRPYLFFPVICLFSLTAHSQVKVRELPSPGFEERITAFIDSMHIVDTHEHLLSPAKLKQRTTLDFMVLFHHYSADDIKSAGMTDKTFGLLLKDSLAPAEKWKLLEPYWKAAGNTGYNRVALLTADKLFGVNDINESTVAGLSEKIANAYRTDWINNVLENKCKADFIIQDNNDRTYTSERFRYLFRFDNYIFVNSRGDISSIEKQRKISVRNIDDLEKALEASFRSALDQGCVGVKTGLAYNRILRYDDVSREKAESVLKLILDDQEDKDLEFDIVKPLQDYMMHRVLDNARKNRLPVAIHTGLQTGNGNIIENTKPTHLVNLFMEYPDVNFVLYHGSFPYGGELTTIAKYFRNVYIDLCWLYVISPSYSERFLTEWLETVPASKIMGFGGDYLNVENVYGHQLFARQVIARVLCKKVGEGYFSEREATEIAGMILHDNAVKFYRLGL